MIPKIIHYCWFGGNPLPKLAKKCIRSWKKYCPDYQIIEWNENNFDIQSAPLYVRQAYEAKKWAFVTDYVRLFALTTQGGIYMDTDVEVIRPLDGFLKHTAFSGFESPQFIHTGIMACEQGNDLFVAWLKEYDNMQFILADGTFNQQTNVKTITNSMLQHGIKLDNSYQEIAGCAFYPNDYFCPKDLRTNQIITTNRTHTIHHFSGSWLDESQRKAHKKWVRAERRDRLIHAPNRFLLKLLGQEKYDRFKKIFKR